MVTKLKKMSRRIEENGIGRRLLVAGIWVTMVLFFMGLGFAGSSVENMGMAIGDLREKEYVNSQLHRQDVVNALNEVHSNLTSNDPVPSKPSKDWKFQGIYDFVINRGSVLYKHKTNIPNEAYEEYLSKQETERESTEEGILELDGEKGKMENVSEPDITKSPKLAHWYFEQNLSCYYLWDGQKFAVGNDVGEDVKTEVQSQFAALGEERQIGIGFTDDMLSTGQRRLDQIRRNILAGGALCVLAFVIMIFGSILFLLGNQEHSVRKCYSDVAGLICLAACIGILAGFQWMKAESFRYIEDSSEIFHLTFRFVLPRALWMGTMLFVIGFCIYLIVKNLRRHIRVEEHFLFLWLARGIFERISGKAYYGEGIAECSRKRRKTVFFILLGIFLVSVIPLYIMPFWYAEFLYFHFLILHIFCFLLAGAVIAIYCYGSRKITREYGQLMAQVEELFKGNYQNDRLLAETSVFSRESLKLSMLGCQIQENIEKQLHAEKMKIDLVTNVSHDLKTPLTSIISYIDLLSREDLDPVARDYVKVLEQKSDRLKKMIADVFDLTKASSRNLKVEKEKLDFHKLLVQVLADMEQEIEKAPVKVIREFSDEAAMIDSDGQKLYRVLQNVLDNALRYSMPETRVYITLTRKQKGVVLRVKNVSGYEMNFTKEEVLGRFFRGDKARSTEGSGLGLAIAKEFTEVCGGTFDVGIDGDVFWTEICFPDIH